MNYLSKSSLCLLAVVTSLTATAQETLSDKLQYKVTGRMLMDGGVYLRNDNHFGNGTEFNDLRVGMRATYQRWDMKVEIGYVGSKVSIKDAFATYTSGKHIIQDRAILRTFHYGYALQHFRPTFPSVTRFCACHDQQSASGSCLHLQCHALLCLRRIVYRQRYQ